MSNPRLNIKLRLNQIYLKFTHAVSRYKKLKEEISAKKT